MRQERTVQSSIFDLFAGHEIGQELRRMSQWLDGHRALLGLVAEDLRRHGVKQTGREGLPAESVLRCALLKQHPTRPDANHGIPARSKPAKRGALLSELLRPACHAVAPRHDDDQ